MTRWMLALVLVAGCPSDDDAAGDDTDVGDTEPRDTDEPDTDVGEGMPDHLDCSDDATVLGLDEDAPLGFSGQDVLDATAAATARTGDYAAEEGGGSTTVHVTVTSRGDPTFHAREPVVDTDPDTDLVEGPPLGAPDEGGCPDHLEVPVTVRLATDDGRFDETVDATILVADLASVSVSGDLAWDALGGTFTLQGIDPADWDTVSMGFSSQWTADGLSGQVDVSASRGEDDTDGIGEGYVGPVLRWPGD